MQLIAFALLRVVVGPGRFDVGFVWALEYGLGYIALCRVLKTRRSRGDASA